MHTWDTGEYEWGYENVSRLLYKRLNCLYSKVIKKAVWQGL